MLFAYQYRRLAGIVLLLAIGLGWVGWRLFDIQVIHHAELRQKARRYAESTYLVEAWRGKIKDRNGLVLATSVPEKTVYINLMLCSNRVEHVARTCGALLGLPAAEVGARLQGGVQSCGTRGRSRRSMVLKRHVSVEEWESIRSALALETFGLPLAGKAAPKKGELWSLRHRLLFTRDSQARAYPYGESLAQVLGFVGARAAGSGLEGRYGLERAFNNELAGKNGFRVSEQDAAGNEVPWRRVYDRPAVPGADVVLTVDMRVQRIVEETLAAARTNYHARGASAVVMDPHSFEVLAAAGVPAFNPEMPAAAARETWPVPAFSDRVEPGSTFKMITLAAGLELGLIRLDGGVYCERGHFAVNHVTVRDHAPYGRLSWREAFAKSSNIAFAKLALELGPQRFYRAVTNFGFGDWTRIPTLGETPGRIRPEGGWTTMALTRAAFGQGVSVSQLQMAVATCVIANQGRLLRPVLVRRIVSAQGAVLRESQPAFVRAVIRPETARQVGEAMEAVVLRGGTGTRAAVADCRIAAKTGTAQKSNSRGYIPGRYYSSMVGFFPADAPRVVIAVALDEPENGYYAGTVVGPVFRSLAAQIASTLGIAPAESPGAAPGRVMPASPSPAQPFNFAAVAKPIRPAGAFPAVARNTRP